MLTIAIVDKDIQLTKIYDANALKQRIKNRLSLFLGEWFLDTAAGVNWFSVLEKTNPTTIENLVRRELSKDENIISINSITAIIIDSLEKSQTYSKPIGYAIVNYEVNSIYGAIRGVL